MKKIIFIGVTIIITVIGFYSCKKENIINPTTPSSSEFSFIEKSRINYSNVDVVNKDFLGKKSSSTMLSFNSMESFQFILTELEKEVNNLDSAFVSFYKNLDEEAINAKEEEISFNEEKPYYTFEKALGFYSLHNQIEGEMKNFLNQETPDWDNSPDDHFIADRSLRVLLNPDAEVMIGNSIYKFYEDGSYHEITDKSMKSLQTLNQLEKSNSKNVILHNADNLFKSSGCKTNKSSKGDKTLGSYRIKWKVNMYNYPWGCVMKSHVDSYKWHGGWLRKWKKHRTYLKAGIEGKYCNSNGTLSASTGWVYSDRYNKKSWSVKITGVCRTKSGQVHGYHYGNGISYNSTFIF